MKIANLNQMTFSGRHVNLEKYFFLENEKVVIDEINCIPDARKSIIICG